jgi:uncharacterized iron-regulated protein
MNILVTVKSLKPVLNVLLMLLAIHVSVSAKDQSRDWQAAFFQDHQLVGKIWDSYKNTWLTNTQFNNELLHYDYILLGETHNNPDHHQLQAEVINALVKAGTQPTVVMEMLSQKAWQNQPHIWRKASELQELAGMLNTGWPWELYTPILQSVVQNQLELYAGNIGSDELHQWANKQGHIKKNHLVKEFLFTDESFNTLTKDIIDSHCGHGDGEFVNFMASAQMQRDRIMAVSLIGKKIPVVLIAGAGHIRNDYAVPMRLRKQFKQTSYLSIAFISVQEEVIDPTAYLQDVPDLYDILYFTPSHTNQDPCEEFSKQLKNMRHKLNLIEESKTQ